MNNTHVLPEVSVILATFNRQNLVGRAIRSVLSQDFLGFELIVVDDGSTDQSAEVIAAFRLKDSRVSYIHQQNQGLASARNSGVAAAKGRYVTFLDSDDEYHRSHLRLRKEMLDANPQVMMLHGGVEVINGSSLVPDYYHPGRLVDIQICAVGATFFYRRELHSLIGGFRDREFGEDTEFFERANQSVKVERVTWATYRYYRDSTDSIVTREIKRTNDLK
jgi:glycosyltransferase involved in cell wall biosynthesis